MLFPVLIPLKIDDEPKWTGEVKAFARYFAPDCLPQEKLGIVYVARKRFEDGSTVTLVRSVPIDSIPTLKAFCFGEGRIVRDPSGAATHITIEDRCGTPEEARFDLDPNRGVLVGEHTHDGFVDKNLTLPNPKAYVLDPTEALAFGSRGSLADGWLLPVGPYGVIDSNAPAIGDQYRFASERSLAYDLAGRREMFRCVDITRNWIGSSAAKDPESAGCLLFHSDGSLAAYAPSLVEALPGRMFWTGTYDKDAQRPIAPPPFALRGKLARLWDQGPDYRSRATASNDMLLGVLVSTSVSDQERSALLDEIQPLEKKTTPEDSARVAVNAKGTSTPLQRQTGS